METYDFGYPKNIGRDLVTKAASLAFIQEKANVVFLGPSGVGKTHLAVGILQALISERGAKGIFYDYRDLLKQVQNSYNSSVNTTEMERLGGFSKLTWESQIRCGSVHP